MRSDRLSYASAIYQNGIDFSTLYENIQVYYFVSRAGLKPTREYVYDFAEQYDRSLRLVGAIHESPVYIRLTGNSLSLASLDSSLKEGAD